MTEDRCAICGATLAAHAMGDAYGDDLSRCPGWASHISVEGPDAHDIERARELMRELRANGSEGGRS